MRFFHDAEFLEDGSTIDLISYAIVADDESQDELYLINRDANWERISKHKWLAANVLPHLPGSWRPAWEVKPVWDRGESIWQPDSQDSRVVSRSELARRVEAFVSSFGQDRSMHELWAWYGAYDHVVMAQLFGPMMQLPRSIPMHTNDLKTLVGEARIPELLRPGREEHNALADARFDRRLYDWAQERLLAAQRQRETYAVRNSEPYRQVFALAVAWEGLTQADRDAMVAACPSATLWDLLADAAAVAEAAG